MISIYRLLLQLTTGKKNLWLVFYFLCGSILCGTVSVSAQIVPDSTLPNNSVVVPDQNGSAIEITGGTEAGSNLFHSFREFSVPNGQAAFFNNGLNIDNIFSRVTGNSISNIEGTISNLGNTNLFLINPNGIIFGENASLNIGGSFIGSTANSIQFNDGSFYSAIAPQVPPLLEINIPVGLQYGMDSGNIIVAGTGNNTGFADPGNNNYSLIKNFRPAGLQVADGNTLALIGGNIALDGGNLTAAEGHIELGSIAEGTVELDRNNNIWNFNYQDAVAFKDIALVNAASVEVSGNSSGTVGVQGQNITLSDASAILSNTSGDGTAGSINLKGTESVQVTGTSLNEIPFVSYVSTGTTVGSTGKGADLNIDTNYLLVAGGAQVDTPVFGAGDAGTLNVNADRIELIAGSPVAGSSGLFAPVVPGATGAGGDINVDTSSLLVAGGAQLFAFSVSSSAGGDISINAEEIQLDSTSPNGTPSGLFTNTFANGNSGNLTINTQDLIIQDGADIATTVFGIGTAGDIKIEANNIELKDFAAQNRTSQISASITEGANGVAGNIVIETYSLSLTDGTQINSNIFGLGEGGNVNITAKEINLSGYSSTADTSSGIFTTIVPGANGQGGNLTVTTDNLSLADGAQIAVATGSSDSAGDLTITASDTIELTGNAIDAGGGSSGLFSSAVLADGDGGNVDLTARNLIVENGATISAGNFLSGNANVPPGKGKAGNIEINAQEIQLDGIDRDTPASITAATFDGGGGNIAIATDLLNIVNGAEINSNSTGKGQAGNIAIAAKDLNLDRGNITATSVETGGGEIDLDTDSVFLDNNSVINTSVLDSTGGGGNIFIDNRDLIIGRNNSSIKADAVFGQGGNIFIRTTAILFDFDSTITVRSDFGLSGNREIENVNDDRPIELDALPEKPINATEQITSSCQIAPNAFSLTGQGGLPDNPLSHIRNKVVWQDTRLPVFTSERVSLSSFVVAKKNTKFDLIESDNWKINNRGNIELIAVNNRTELQVINIYQKCL